MIFVSVGFGFFVEFTLDEALGFIDKKATLLTDQADSLTKSASEIKAHIKVKRTLILFRQFKTCANLQ